MYLPYSLFISYLCLSLYICTARPLVTFKEAASTQFNISGKVPEKLKKLSAEHEGVTEREGIKVQSNGGVIAEGSKPSKDLPIPRKDELSGLVPVKSLVSVSWRVPHKKRDQHPGFYSDYSRPRTRPPSHN